ncbi:Multifunctional alkaline phosphatase superfamily protein [Fusarium oxysporum f. sp. albedinis]|nr:Multifunctional alkaline phosphatase superfamily protein [Fusarium oxysporum f. sp. albedinis]
MQVEQKLQKFESLSSKRLNNSEHEKFAAFATLESRSIALIQEQEVLVTYFRAGPTNTRPPNFSAKLLRSIGHDFAAARQTLRRGVLKKEFLVVIVLVERLQIKYPSPFMFLGRWGNVVVVPSLLVVVLRVVAELTFRASRAISSW